MKLNTGPLAIIALLLVAAFFVATTLFSGPVDGGAGKGELATIFKSPDCGCCVGHGHFLGREGFQVETVETVDMASVKQKYNIPPEMQSCHTTLIGGYFVEGHVPIEAIEKLLEERPDIDGIALPDMPAGSPGMPGVKSGQFTIYALTDGVASEYMVI